MSHNVAIVVVAFNRPKSLRRVLKSLNNVNYLSEDNIELIISIDKSTSAEVYEVAEQYHFEHGSKEIIKHEANLGLKNHVLKCGDISERYDAVILLEDDLIVSPTMYEYAISCVEMYDSESSIAGISLYTHLRNFHNNMPFTPLKSSYDVFFMQIAQSWGQVWTRRMWMDFRDWYDEFILREDKDIDNLFPDTIQNWGEKSWLKYFMIFIYEKNKFFVYPYDSHSTNFTEIGTHNKQTSTNYQVPLKFINEKKPVYNLPECISDGIMYDIYFESLTLKKLLTSKYPNIMIDLYGLKLEQSESFSIEQTEYVLTSKLIPCLIVESYSRELRPVENNILYDIEGEQLFVYDLKKFTENKGISKKNILYNELYKLEYYYQISSTRLLIRFLQLNLIKRIRKFLGGI